MSPFILQLIVGEVINISLIFIEKLVPNSRPVLKADLEALIVLGQKVVVDIQTNQ